MEYEVNDRIIQLIDEKQISKRKVAEIIGVSPGNITDWDKHRTKPSIDALIKLCEYLNVSADYILKGYENQYTEEEQQLIRDYRLLKDKEKGIILGRIEQMLKEEKPPEGMGLSSISKIG